MIRILSKLGIEGNFLSLIKNIYKKINPYTHIMLNGDELETFSIRSGTGKDVCLLPLLFNIVLVVLANAIIQEKDMRGRLNGKEEIKLSLFVYDIIIFCLCRKSQIESWS